MSGRTYYFPFRVHLKPIREFVESMVKPEFSYVAENLLLRGGYCRTHFQADINTLQLVSQMGEIYNKPVSNFQTENERFEVRFTFNKQEEYPPYILFS